MTVRSVDGDTSCCKKVKNRFFLVRKSSKSGLKNDQGQWQCAKAGHLWASTHRYLLIDSVSIILSTPVCKGLIVHTEPVKKTGTTLLYWIVAFVIKHATLTKVIKPTVYTYKGPSFHQNMIQNRLDVFIKTSPNFKLQFRPLKDFEHIVWFHLHWSSIRQQQSLQRATGTNDIYTMPCVSQLLSSHGANPLKK